MLVIFVFVTVVVLNLSLAACVTKLLARLFSLGARRKSPVYFMLASTALVCGALVGFLVPVLTLGVLEESRILVFHGLDAVLLKMVGMGILAAFWGAYLGLKWAKEAAQPSV